MSKKKTYTKSNIQHRSLNGSGQKYKSASSLKATNTTYVKTTKKSTRPAQTVKATDQKQVKSAAAATAAAVQSKKTAEAAQAKKATSAQTKKTAETKKQDTSEKSVKSILEPAFLTRKSSRTSSSAKKTSRFNYRWSMLIPAIAVILCLALFVVASQAGWIQTFLTPESRRVVKETAPTEPETTTQKETETQTTTVEETTTETTTEETTTEFVPSYYVINVNLGYNRVTVYSRGEKLNNGADPKDPHDDEYDLIPEIAFTCSPGLDATTPTGTFYLQNRTTWCLMIHDVYTQYATRIVDDVMFHSIPYLSENPGDLATYDYNILGQDASAACIRLNVRDAAWIFNNCPEGTEVNIFYDYTWPGPIDPEPTYQIPEGLDPLSGWDPTDVYSGGNPWLTYEPYLGSQDVTLPCYSAPDTLIAMVSPMDDYGNNLANYFYTDGGYDLTTPGTYQTTAHIALGTYATYNFPLTITVTEEYADNTLGYYDEYGDFIYYETYEEEGADDGSGDEYSDGNDDGTGEDYDYWYSEEEGGEESWNEEYYGYDAAGPEGEDIYYSEDTGYVDDSGYVDDGSYVEGW